MKITIEIGEELFQFTTFNNWCDTAQAKFKMAGLRGQDTLCVDTLGRICTKGLEFMRADEEKTFPIRVFRKLLD